MVNIVYYIIPVYRLISCFLSAECTFLCYCIPNIDILYFRFRYIIHPKSISMIYKQLTTYFKVKYGSIMIGYYKSHGVVIKVI